MPLPRSILNQLQKNGLFSFSPANEVKDVAIKEDTSETKGTITFYGTQSFSTRSEELNFCIVACLIIDKTDHFKSKANLKNPIQKYFSDLPKEHSFGSIKLLLEDSSLRNPIMTSRAESPKQILAIDVYKATVKEDKTSADFPDARGVQSLARLLDSTATPKEIGVESGAGTCFRCQIGGKKKVLKIPKVSLGSALGELEGNELVSRLGRSETRISISDVKVYKFVSSDWRRNHPLIVMADVGESTSENMDKLSPTLRRLPDPKSSTDSPTASPVLSPASPTAAGGSAPVIDYPNLKKWLKSACESIAVLHGDGIVHLDIKPSNIGCKLTANSSEPRFSSPSMGDSSRGLEKAETIAPLFDFGTASMTRSAKLNAMGKDPRSVKVFIDELKSKCASGIITQDDVVDFFFELAQRCIKGTKEYMAPEIKEFTSEGKKVFDLKKLGAIINVLVETKGDSEAKDITPEQKEAYGLLKKLLTIGRKADVYSLGASIVEILCKAYDVKGCTSYDQSALDKVINEIKGKKLIPIDPNLLDLLGNMLATDPGKRYSIYQVQLHKFLR